MRMRQASAWLSTVAPQPSRVMTDVASSEDLEDQVEAASNSAWLSTAAPNQVASDEEAPSGSSLGP